MEEVVGIVTFAVSAIFYFFLFFGSFWFLKQKNFGFSVLVSVALCGFNSIFSFRQK